jgi:hypothetical protein
MDFFDASWRAAAYCLHPRVIAWSLLPLLVAGGAVLGLGWWTWEPVVAGLRAQLDSWELLGSLLAWLESVGLPSLRSLLAPLILVALAVPLLVVATLLCVAWLMMPAMTSLVARRRFPLLQRRASSLTRWQGLLWALTCTVAALGALLVSLPLWFVPPLVLLLPPLIWGWLTYRVLAFDALALHAEPGERRRLLRDRRWPLRVAGMVLGFLGTAPSLLWAFGAVSLVLAPLLLVVSVWLYTLVFAYASLWFAHYLLAALQQLRSDAGPGPAAGLDDPPGPAPAGLLPGPPGSAPATARPPAAPPPAPPDGAAA